MREAGSIRACSAILAALLAFCPAPAVAQDSVAADRVIVAAGEGSGNHGRIAINGAAGTGNQQLSSVVLAQGNIASAAEAVRQAIVSAPGDRATTITIADGAFADNSGLVSINLTAGSHNQSANLAILAIGTNGALSDQLLEQSRAAPEPNGGTAPGSVEANDSVAIGDGAFRGGSGLIQVNLTGGERNSSANAFSLSIRAEGRP